MAGDLRLGVDDGGVDDPRAGPAALRRHHVGVRGELHRLGDLRRGDERAAALTADDPSLDGEIVERLAHGRARHVEALAEGALGRHRRSRRHAVDLRAQPLPQLVVLRCAAGCRGVDAVAVADDLDARSVAVEGEHLASDGAVGDPAEPLVEAPRPLVVGDDPQRRRRVAGGGEAAQRLVEQAPPDAVPVERGIDVQRVDVAGPRLRVVVVAGADVGEAGHVSIGPGDDHRVVADGAHPAGPHRALGLFADRRHRRVRREESGVQAIARHRRRRRVDHAFAAGAHAGARSLASTASIATAPAASILTPSVSLV